MTSDFAVVSAAIEFVVANRQTQPTVQAIATHLQLSPARLQRVFTRWAGVSPKRLQQFLNAAAARDLLRGAPVLATADAVGVSSQSRLYDACVQVHAFTPGEIRAGGAEVEIAAGWVDSPFGAAFIATTPRGVCALSFALDGTDPEERLRSDWPFARITRGHQAALADRIFGPLHARTGAPLAVVLKGTNLQLQVWSALLRLPEGTTTSYREIANGVGSPSAVRAVANAIAANRVGYLVPCHRVLRENGTISGYAWGVERKRAMLARERELSGAA